LLCCGAPFQARGAGNLLPNPGFEHDENRDGIPDGWSVKPAETEEARPVRIVQAERHGGAHSLRFGHARENSYSKLRASVPAEPDTDYVASGWFKVGEPGRLQPGIESSGGAKLLVLGLDDEGSNQLGACRSVFSTRNRWERAVVRFNSRSYKRVMVMVYLHNAKGTLWVDDMELVAGADPTAVEQGPAIFPAVHLLPGTAAGQDALHLIRSAPMPLTFHYLGEDAQAGGLTLELEVPAGIRILRDFAGNSTPVGASSGTAQPARYLLPVPAGKVRQELGSKYGHMLILEATRAAGPAGALTWRLRRGDSTTEPRRLALTVLPALQPLTRTPERFEIFTFYNDALRLCPAGQENDRLFERLFQLAVESGFRGGVLPAVSRDRAKRILERQGWATGVLAGWMVSPEQYFDKTQLEEAQSVDAQGKPYPGIRPCPTYCQDHNVMAKVARLYYERRIAPRASADMLQEGDWYVFDYEPGRGIWRECRCPRCLKAFAAHSGIAADRLAPPGSKPRWAAEWQRFRDWQKGAFMAQFSRAVDTLSPKLRFGLCDHPFETRARDVVEPHIDFYCPMMYNVHPRKFFDDVARELRVKKPFMPTIETCMLGYTQWTAPRELKLKIITGAATGAKGIMIWPGMTSLGGLDLALIRQCNDILVEVGGYYALGKRRDELFDVRPARQESVHWGQRAHELDGRRLLTLFNFHSRAPAVFSVSVPDIGAGEHSVSDPVTGAACLAPATESRVWRPADLRAGLPVEVAASDIAFLLVGPAGERL